jgi:flagellar protein FliO/FliZ
LNKKKYFYVIAAVFLFSFAAFFMPSLASASADTNVSDWLQEKEPGTEQPAQETKAEPVEEQSLFGTVLKLIFYTVLILAMIYGLIKFLAIRQQKFQPNQAVKLMGGTPLGNNKSLQLVKVGGKIYMIGVGDEVTLIKEFTDTEEAGLIEKDLEKQPTVFSNPKFKLPKKLFGGTDTDTDIKKELGFEKLFKQSLNKQKQKQQQLEQGLSDTESDKEGNAR